MSAVEDTVTQDRGDLDVPMQDAAPNPTGNFNQAPPPLPELFDDKGKSVAYIADVKLGRDGIKKVPYDLKENGVPTGEKAVFFEADALFKITGPADGREFDVRNFDTIVRPSERYKSFVPRGKEISPLGHLAQIAGLDLTAYAKVGDMVTDLAQALQRKGEDTVKAKIFGQWQWRSSTLEWTDNKGNERKGKTVRYGMKNADTITNGVAAPKITFKETGEELQAKFVVTRIEPLK